MLSNQDRPRRVSKPIDRQDPYVDKEAMLELDASHERIGLKRDDTSDGGDGNLPVYQANDNAEASDSDADLSDSFDKEIVSPYSLEECHSLAPKGGNGRKRKFRSSYLRDIASMRIKTPSSAAAATPTTVTGATATSYVTPIAATAAPVSTISAATPTDASL
jgi:hypothetical protein